MSNRFQVLLKSEKGIELDSWLRGKSQVFKNQTNMESLDNMRIFYIVKAAFEEDTNVYKIGISERGAHAAKGRLIDYVYSYGIADKSNPCKGVKIYLVLANYFNPDVEASNSYVRKLETLVKAKFKEIRDRGAERLNIPIKELFEYLEETNQIFEGDTESETKKTPRLLEKGQAARDAVKSIIEEKTDRKGNVKYLVAFSDIAFKYNDNENQKQNKRPNEVLTYEQIIQLPRGKQLLDEFIKNKQNKTITSKSGSKITNLGNDATKKNNQENDTVSNRTRSAKITNL
jgi:hypothetical protein